MITDPVEIWVDATSSEFRDIREGTCKITFDREGESHDIKDVLPFIQRYMALVQLFQWFTD